MGNYFSNLDIAFWPLGVIIVCVITVACFSINIGNGADGVATDSIARISYGGWVWQTWKIQLTNDHPTQGNDMIYAIDRKDTDLVKQLQVFADSGQRVKIYYHSNLINFAWDYSDAEVIYKVEPVVVK